MKKIITAVLILFCFIHIDAQKKNLSKYIDPFIGTGFHGHTFPGACLPFGMVQLSPDTDIKEWDWCSGYHSSDSSIMGFSHTHLSGTGAHDLGDILFMPYTGDWKILPGRKSNPIEGYRSLFSHEDEKAEAGYYSVFLKSYKIKVELTATKRSGFHKYTFPKSDKSNIIIDLNHGIFDKTAEARIEKVDDQTIKGYRKSKGWAQHTIYFCAVFSKPIKEFAVVNEQKIIQNEIIAEGKDIKALLRFSTDKDEIIHVKVGLSPVSSENAMENLYAEIGNNDFIAIRKAAFDEWNSQLQSVEIETGSEEKKRTFYTAMYHAQLVPYIFTDINRQYMGMDNKVYKAEGFDYYTLFSLWDTYRAAHPLYSIIAPEYNNDFVKSLIAKFEESGRLPVWELHSSETWCMIGYHSIPVIADAILKGYGNFDIQKGYIAMKNSAEDSIRGLTDYKKYGYIPFDKLNNSVSITLEYAFDDWCIAQVAKKLGYSDDYKLYLRRAMYYKNIFDVKTGFVRGKDSNGNWRENFNPMSVSILGKGDFTEGNAWHYTFYVPQDLTGLIELIGGREKFASKIDSIFVQPAVNDNEHSLDITGMIGQYVHGNEPSHHIAYLYNFAGQPFKTQEKVSYILKNLYSDKRDGLCGNEDCGQMSAWYIMSSIGFYPVNPASGEYIIGSPIFDKVTINLSNSKKFIIKAINVSDKNIYIQSAKLNNKDYAKSFITHEQVVSGGEIVFIMGDKPSKWGTAIEDCPESVITE
ncbi:MAG: GH92 family glycosyl hydrolase [Ignavibacteriaceae bacterium]